MNFTVKHTDSLTTYLMLHMVNRGKSLRYFQFLDLSWTRNSFQVAVFTSTQSCFSDQLVSRLDFCQESAENTPVTSRDM